jgi:hypothetical protein
MTKPQEIIELSGGEFSAMILLGGIFSPIVYFLSLILEVFEKWL